MKKGFKYFCLFFAAIMIFGVLVSVGTIKMPSSDDSGKDHSEPVKPTVTYYPIYTDLENTALTSYTSMKVSDTADTVCLVFTANEGYKLPEVVTVTGCDYMWDVTKGYLFLANAKGNVNVSVKSVVGDATDTPVDPIYYSITVNRTKTNASSANVNQMSDKDGYVVLHFEAYEGYYLPETVTVTGCKYLWNASAGTLTLSNPTADITVSIVSREYCYTVTEILDGVTAKSSNSEVIYGALANMNTTFYYTANEGYTLPSKITVYGAEYSWIKSTGMLIITNVTSDVVITVKAEPISYKIQGSFKIDDEPDLEALAELWSNPDSEYLFADFETDGEIWQGMFVDDVDADGVLDLCYYVPAYWGEHEGAWEAVYSTAYGWKDSAYQYINFGTANPIVVSEAFYVGFTTIAAKA